MIAGILLAAGFSSRFGSDKLLMPLSDGQPMALRSAVNLLSAVPVVAVVRPEQVELRDALAGCGAEIVLCGNAHEGLAASLICGVAAAEGAHGWIVALADMPFIRPQTIGLVAAHLQAGGELCAPQYRGERGHPVGFSSRYRNELLGLSGDQGAQSILKAHARALTLLSCEDPGVLRDIDLPGDLRG